MNTPIDTFKKTLQLLFYAAIIAIMFAIVLPYFVKDKNTNEYIEKLKQQNDSIEKYKAKLMSIDSLYSIKIDSLIHKKDSIKIKTVYINNQRNEKIRIIDRMSTDSLYNFFSGVKAYHNTSR